MKISRTLAPALALALGAVTAFAYDAKKVEKGATIKGRVTFAGDMSLANLKEPSSVDPACCGAEHVKPELIVDAQTHGLKDAVVFLKSVDAGKPFPDEQRSAVIDQKGCVFEKHVTLIAAGGEITFKNSDSVFHNVSSVSLANPRFNEGLGAGQQMKKTFEKPELIRLSCSAHTWMNALIVVMAHPYYTVTDAHGEFALADVPAGKFTIVVQHQTLGRADKKGRDVEIAAGETKTLDFEIK